MAITTSTREWIRLLALTSVHFLIDAFGGVLPPLVPNLQEHFSISLKAAVFFLGLMHFACNFSQIFTGRFRANKTKPCFLYLGLILGVMICLLPLLPAKPSSYYLLLALGVVSGFGIASAHPEGLRAVHKIETIPPALATAVFMSGGFLGFASGGLLGAALVNMSGLPGLYFLIPFAALGFILIASINIKLAIEKTNHELETQQHNQYPFWPVLAIAIPLATSSTFLVSLIPTALFQLDFTTTFGAFSTMMFGIGSLLGSFVSASVAHRKGELRTAIVGLLIGVFILILYTLLMHHKYACILIFAVGFTAAGTFPLVITIARHALGLNLGQRMGFVVGGAWGSSSLVLMACSPLTEMYGVRKILFATPAGFLIAAIIAILLLFSHRKNESNS